jgi:Glycosyl transferases group 1
VHVLRAPIDLTPYVPQVMGTPDAVPMKLIHLGSLAGNHGLPLLLEALERANQTAPVTLTIVGPPHAAWRARLEDQLSGLELAGKVDFQAPVPHDDLHKILAAADVGALSTDNGQRNTVVGAPLSRLGEYLAAGRPVIAADVPSVRALAPEDVVVWYEAGDFVSLSDAILSLATDPVRRVALGRKAREAASKWDAMIIRADLIALYTAITGTVAPRVAEEDERADPNEVTQMGSKVPFAAKDDSAPGTNKVHVTAGTDPAGAGLEGPTDLHEGRHRPSVMGVPIREDEPVVAGVELPPPVPSSPRVTAALVREVPDAGSTAATCCATSTRKPPPSRPPRGPHRRCNERWRCPTTTSRSPRPRACPGCRAGRRPGSSRCSRCRPRPQRPTKRPRPCCLRSTAARRGSCRW